MEMAEGAADAFYEILVEGTPRQVLRLLRILNREAVRNMQDIKRVEALLQALSEAMEWASRAGQAKLFKAHLMYLLEGPLSRGLREAKSFNKILTLTEAVAAQKIKL